MTYAATSVPALGRVGGRFLVSVRLGLRPAESARHVEALLA
ncbi:MAG: hypothetical protein ABR587_17520 [Candidatus Binatia bacterium]